MAGIVNKVEEDRSNLENDDEDDNADDLVVTKLMDITITIFNVVRTGIKRKVDGQGNIFCDDYQEVEKLS